MSDGNYVTLGDDRNPVHVWYDAKDEEIHLTCNDPRLNGQKPGLHVVVNAKLTSANYNPATFNQLARLLRLEGKSAPAEAELHPRQLAQRDQVIKQAGG